MKHTSIWNEYIGDNNKHKSLKKDIKVKVLVIGGGITGILCANELKNRDIDYILVEKDTIASKTSKDTTAFLSIFHDILYQDLIKSKGLDKAKDYFKFNQDAIESYYKLSLQYDFDFKRCSSIIYTNKDVDKINNEKEALDKIGVSSEFIDKLPINLPFTLGLKVENQATINPVKLIFQLSKELNIFENTCIHKIKNSIAYTTNGQRIIFNKVIMATKYPIKNISGLYFMKLIQKKSYVASINYPEIENTYTCIDDNGFYFRSYNDNLIIGGFDSSLNKMCMCDFKNQINKYFKDYKINYIWSGQDCYSLDGIPYIGEYSMFNTNIYVATGFNLWGYTWAMASSIVIADLIENKVSSNLFYPSRSILKKQLLTNIVNSLKNIINFKKPKCPHMKSVLHYDNDENIYQCITHGSKFNSDGKVIEGPSKKDIEIKK